MLVRARALVPSSRRRRYGAPRLFRPCEPLQVQQTPASRRTNVSSTPRALRWARRAAGLRWYAFAVGAVVIAVLGVLGTIYSTGAVEIHGRFNLDGERTYPALFSSALLLTAAVLALVLAVVGDIARAALGSLAVLFAFMAIDEWHSIHEFMEARSGIDWQVLYIPIIVAGAAAFLAVMRRVSRGGKPGGGAMLAGAAAWGFSQLLEAIQWGVFGGEESDVYAPLMITEEIGEMVGSLLFVFGLLSVLSVRAPRPSAAEGAVPGSRAGTGRRRRS